MMIEAANITHAKPEKFKNGDYCATRFLESESITLAVLSDGVSQSPCDWKASKMGCELFISYFEQLVEIPMIQRIEQAVEKMNKELVIEQGPCKGLKATFSVVVWAYESGNTYWLNIGDSRIYLLKGQSVEQLSTDDSKAVAIKKKNGKPMVIAGAIAVGQGLTNAIGLSDLTYQCQSISDQNVEAVILASDGFYDCRGSFQSDTLACINEVQLQYSLERLSAIYRDYQSDDMSVVILRKKASANNQPLWQSILLGEVPERVDLNLKQSMIAGLAIQIEQKSVASCLTLLQYVANQNIDLGKKQLIDFIEQMASSNFQNGEVYQQLLNCVRKSKG